MIISIKERAKNDKFLHLSKIHQICHLKNDLISILSSNNSYYQSGRRGDLLLPKSFLIFLKFMVIGFVFPRAFFLSLLQLNSSASNVEVTFLEVAVFGSCYVWELQCVTVKVCASWV